MAKDDEFTKAMRLDTIEDLRIALAEAKQALVEKNEEYKEAIAINANLCYDMEVFKNRLELKENEALKVRESNDALVDKNTTLNREINDLTFSYTTLIQENNELRESLRIALKTKVKLYNLITTIIQSFDSEE